jgi:hypothetical protein
MQMPLPDLSQSGGSDNVFSGDELRTSRSKRGDLKATTKPDRLRQQRQHIALLSHHNLPGDVTIVEL